MISEEIDIIKLYSGAISGFEDHRGWNNWLTLCYDNDNFDELVKVRRGLQMGMATAEKAKLADQKIAETFCRWIGSIDKTIRRIVKKRDSLANDEINNKFTTKASLKDKRERDSELEKYLRKNSY
jgi:hypothetical protein